MIGKKIYQYRIKRGLTLSELAERAGIAKSYLSNIERSLNRNPSIQVVEKIALVLDVDIGTLLDIHKSKENQLETEWVEFVNELKESGIEKKQIQEYKTLIEFIKWKKENEER
ncbi:XRE family transcriptional regulator [Robertmurraya yapensis]|uniref:XRE family transcriptional regulator n=2 Tax=Bacillaceae TaxID=186817 RepID=A0A431W3J5_9BACI|nr:helix-turn-helix transcriptional regulator [Bacillus yapensis]RTR30010.1 XRE family transcriptional regulator [Bacillus yapensis]TKS95091.1 helix-turn-helix domain-containing protein [Bacillus yapensis]